jgi:hypothetical protein
MPKLSQSASVAAAVLILVSAGCSKSTQSQQVLTQTSGDLTVQFTGEDTAVVTVTSNGQPVDDANVLATANMRAPKLAGSPASGRFEGNGQYNVPLRLVATTYDVDVKIVRLNKPAVELTFPVEAWQ